MKFWDIKSVTSHSAANQPAFSFHFSSSPPLLSSVPPQTLREGVWSGRRPAAPGGSRQSPEPSAALAPFAVYTTTYMGERRRELVCIALAILGSYTSSKIG